MIYLDHAASSYPKPKAVSQAMVDVIENYSANPGRGGHQLAEKAAAVIHETRVQVAKLFGAPAAKHVWFYQNATVALNQALFGFPFQQGDHILTTAFEHNSVLRPLTKLAKEKGITVQYLKPNQEGIIPIESFREAVRPETKMIAVTHGSNVTGACLSLKPLGELAEEVGAVLLVDASQTAGAVPINMETDKIDLLAFTGHKGLLGPQGTGGLISYGDYQLEPLLYGGTGRDSERDEQPEQWPERYEAGTLNTAGIAGLSKGIEEINRLSIEHIYEHEQTLLCHCLKGLDKLESVSCYRPGKGHQQLGVLSFRMDSLESHELAMVLDQHYHIAVRAGLHCAPQTHQALQTSDTGLVRVSFGPYNTLEEVDQLIQALTEIEAAFN